MYESECTLCYERRKACKEKYCSWVRDFTPVEGWEAEYNEKKDSYRVISCPEFERGRGLPKDLDTEGCMRLLEAAMELMRDDYIHGRGLREADTQDKQNKKPRNRFQEDREKTRKQVNREEIERFLRSKRGHLLLDLSDVESVIQMLQNAARAHDTALMR